MKRWKVALVSAGLLGCFFTVVETAKAEEGTWQGRPTSKQTGNQQPSNGFLTKRIRTGFILKIMVNVQKMAG